jgi:hypothetical protein
MCMTDAARFAVALTVWIASVLGCAALSGRTDSLRRYARVLGVVVWLSPLLVPPTWVAARVVLGAFAVLGFGRSLDLVRRPAGLSYWGRVWMLTAVFDVREAQRRPPRFDGREAAWLLVHFASFCVAGWVVFVEVDASAWLLRWGLGVVVVYGLVESVQSVLLLVYAALGVELARVNDYPILSSSLAEFWGRRWNRAVSGWLNDNLFFPLARRRHAVLGICAAFAGSTVLHFWFAWVPLDLVGGMMMATYFVVHGAGMLLERYLGVATWRLGPRRTWTLAWVLLPSPLFIEPALRMLAGFV